MKRSEVARRAAGATGPGRREANAAVKAVLDAIEETLAEGGARRDCSPGRPVRDMRGDAGAPEHSLEARRRESANRGSGSGTDADPEHALGFKVTARR